MTIIYGEKRLNMKTVHGGQIGSLIQGLLSNGSSVFLKGIPKKALKILGPYVLRLLTPTLLQGVDKFTGARDQFLADKPEILKNIATAGTDSILNTVVDEVLKVATKDKKKKAKGMKVPMEMRNMLNKRSELILNNLTRNSY